MKVSLWLVVLCAIALVVPAVTGCDGDGDNNNLGGQSIIFMAQPGEDEEVWGMDTDGSDKVQLAGETDETAIQGTLSPDGQRLLYVRQFTTPVATSQIVVKDLDTSDETVLVTDATTSGNDFAPVYNPQGTRIAYHDDRDGAIHVMNADGTGDVALPTAPEVDDHSPAWNRAGTRIVFDRGWNGSIYTMNANGTDQTLVLAETATVTYGQPQFLPDGRIICMRNNDLLSRDIVMVDADGSDLVNLTPNTDGSDEFFPSVNNAGTRIAFATDRNGERDVYIGTLSENSLVSLTNLTADVSYDCWRPSFGTVSDFNILNFD